MEVKNIFKKLTDSVLIGDWEEVEKMPLSKVTKNDADTAELSGLIVKGYETKFTNGTNTNGERYTKECFDEWVNEYYVKNRLNIPVTLMHGGRFEDVCGRVIYFEVNTTGFYFVAYIPKTLRAYNDIKTAIQEGLLQGFSKEGWALEYEPRYDNKGFWEYDIVTKMMLTAVSLVTTPANGVTFEKLQAVNDATEYRNTTRKQGISRMFN